ncbi:MAG: 2-oxoacid:ferredoxin oxidoreductase subunit gamma [Proteobacteria bacterium]|nr:2-oxoacid:ferredoxin oxidoreductase subunit gamma [Pseudomonadota bacterium]
MIAKLLFAGSGGQGVLTMGNVLGNAAMLEDFHVTFLPEYGAAMRGGTANCTVCISDDEIASPVASVPDVVVSMNQPSVLTFINKLQPGGQLLYNSSIVDTVPVRGDIDLLPVPASQLAQEMGNARSTNMIVLGSFIKLTNIIKVETVNRSVEMLMGKKKKLVEASIKAISIGFEGFPFE